MKSYPGCNLCLYYRFLSFRTKEYFQTVCMNVVDDFATLCCNFASLEGFYFVLGMYVCVFGIGSNFYQYFSYISYLNAVIS